MAFVKVDFMDRAAGRRREKVIEVTAYPATPENLSRTAKRRVDAWPMVSEPRVLAILTEAGWQEVAADGQG